MSKELAIAELKRRGIVLDEIEELGEHAGNLPTSEKIKASDEIGKDVKYIGQIIAMVGYVLGEKAIDTGDALKSITAAIEEQTKVIKEHANEINGSIGKIVASIDKIAKKESKKPDYTNIVSAIKDSTVAINEGVYQSKMIAEAVSIMALSDKKESKAPMNVTVTKDCDGKYIVKGT
jgi:hypothetical protein